MHNKSCIHNLEWFAGIFNPICCGNMKEQVLMRFLKVFAGTNKYKVKQYATQKMRTIEPQ